MKEKPVHWKNYYHNEGDKQAFACEYSFSDRIRYYWPQPMVREGLEAMTKNLNDHPPPLSLISQYMPAPVSCRPQRPHQG